MIGTALIALGLIACGFAAFGLWIVCAVNSSNKREWDE